jgi:hypothetical protein
MKSYWFWSIFSCCLFRACSQNVLFNCPYNVWFSTRINAEPVDLCQESRKELRHWTALFSIWRLCEILLLYLHPAPFNATIWCLEDTQHLLKDFLSRSKIIYMPNLVQKMYLSFAVWYIVFLYRIWISVLYLICESFCGKYGGGSRVETMFTIKTEPVLFMIFFLPLRI